MKNSEIYKIAILAVICWQEDPVTPELSKDNFCEVLYKLTQDWYWSRAAEKDEEAKAQDAKAKEALEQMQEEMRRVSEAYGVETND
jgi:uncharacterized phage-associated protein